MSDRNIEIRRIIDTYTNNWNDYDFKNISWHSSISEGKATIAEIIGHLLNWDQYLIANVIP
ncbi:hypothetical protein [Paenibacillus sp. R14(2021)]|uniref:hypothetical protein n=1 Tax=Paenibacillus sp. R14(2021) TaxID=2859228 RepID=UPI001C6114E6|nr:hypothetical protein [Paenibacillus sp. R14(2021)]